MIRTAPAAWRANMQGSGNEERCHIDFRGIDYPDIGAGSPTFTLGREDNLIDRGNCESATAPTMPGEAADVNTNCTFARSADFAHGGDYSYKFTKTNAAAGIAYTEHQDVLSTTDMHGAVGGQTYEASVWIYTPTAGGITGDEVSIYLFDHDTNDWESTSQSGVVSADAWQKITVTRTLREAANGFSFRTFVAGTADVNEYFYEDDIIVKCHSVPGSHYMSGGYSEHLIELADTGTIQIKFRPTFAYNTGSNQEIGGWYVSATQEFRLWYDQANDIFKVLWEDGGTARELQSAQYDDGSAQRNIKQWSVMTVAYDISDTSNTGSSLWMNKTQDDTTFGATTKDAKSTEFYKMQLRAYNGTAGAYDIAYMLYIPDYVATDADVQNDFKNVKDEQIYFSLDGHSVGRTRCNVSSFMTSLSTQKSTRGLLSGNYGTNIAEIELKSLDGEFADDQYAAFDPANSTYNGLVTQKYMQNRCRVMLENWYGGDFDYLIVGRVDDNYFKRRTMRDGISFVNITVEDGVAEMGRKKIENSQAWENKDICDSTESNSLIHLVSRVQTSKKVRNYAHNSGFENATISNAWTATTLTLTRDTADEFIGSACAKMVYDNIAGGQQNIYQSISFDGDEKLNVGEKWTFSVILKSSAACNNDISLVERDSGGSNDFTNTTYTIAGGENYTIWSVTHTITDSDSDELRIIIYMDDNVTLYGDMVKLFRGDRNINFYVDNTAETLDADDYAEDEYDTIGFDCDAVDIQHPWKRIEEGTTIWDNLTSLAGAALPNYFGMNEAGTLELRAMLTNTTTNTYTDLIAEENITEDDILMNIGVILAPRANRIIVKGSGYAKYTSKECIWRASDMGSFTQGDADDISESIANGDKWPDPDTYGEYYAYYSRVFDKETWNKAAQ